MLAQTSTTVISPLRFLLLNSPAFLLAGGLYFTLWGLWNVYFRSRPRVILAQIVLSLFTGIGAAIAIYVAAAEFSELAAAETAPKPAALAGVVGRAMAYGFVGLFATILPVLLGAMALGRQVPESSGEAGDG